MVYFLSGAVCLWCHSLCCPLQSVHHGLSCLRVNYPFSQKFYDFNDPIAMSVTGRLPRVCVLLAKFIMPHNPAADSCYVGRTFLSAKRPQRVPASNPRTYRFCNFFGVVSWSSDHYGVTSIPSLYSSVTRPGYFLFIWGAAAMAHFSICTLKSLAPNDCTT